MLCVWLGASAAGTNRENKRICSGLTAFAQPAPLRERGREAPGGVLRAPPAPRPARRMASKTIPHSPAAHGRASGEATSRRSGRLCVPSVFHPHPANPVILSRKRCPPRNIVPHAERTAKGEAPPAGILSSGGDDKFWSHPSFGFRLTSATVSAIVPVIGKTVPKRTGEPP